MAARDTEIYKAVRDALLANSALTGLLASADAIWRIYPADSAAFPCISISLGDTPDQGLSGEGQWDCDVKITVYGTNPETNDALKQRIDIILYDRPQVRDGWTTETYRIKTCRRTGAPPPGAPRFTDSNQNALFEQETNWVLRVVKTS